MTSWLEVLLKELLAESVVVVKALVEKVVLDPVVVPRICCNVEFCDKKNVVAPTWVLVA
jgi:hypothetical protein